MTAIDRLFTIEKSDLSNKMKWDFFQVVAVYILLYKCTTWTLTKCIEQKPDGNYTRILFAIKQILVVTLHKTTCPTCLVHLTWMVSEIGGRELYSYLPPISLTIQVRWTRHVGSSWRSKDKLMWLSLIEIYSWMSQCWPTRKALHQLCADSGCSPEHLLSDGW